ncbi:DNA repair protein REV1-like [Pyrus ussuriensis x Pyrus communis]|uniref:DNA repair protein REV1-like n=1 Tax=Pyrus ussuriensis x Pyrus communis TaxID=2448454 RepID=A0A5N5IA11_9ROSA|nr:DNA repair protein REV1-like [Pyrus ussuriensis x Pyrus communis]
MSLNSSRSAGSSGQRSNSKRSVLPTLEHYMLENNRKLHNQFDTEASASSHSGSKTGKDTFRGVSTFADGYTVPPNQGFLVSYDFLLAVLN